jgi:hypothetical protein
MYLQKNPGINITKYEIAEFPHETATYHCCTQLVFYYKLQMEPSEQLSELFCQIGECQLLYYCQKYEKENKEKV